MRVNVLYYAMLRDLMGRGGETVDVEAGASVEDVVRRVRGDSEARVWRVVLVAVNDVWAGMETGLCDGDEVSLMPPVSGGGR